MSIGHKMESALFFEINDLYTWKTLSDGLLTQIHLTKVGHAKFLFP